MAKNGPGDTAVLELLGRDLAGEGTVGLVEDVLCSDLEARAQVFACEKEVESRRSNDDF